MELSEFDLQSLYLRETLLEWFYQTPEECQTVENIPTEVKTVNII